MGKTDQLAQDREALEQDLQAWRERRMERQGDTAIPDAIREETRRRATGESLMVYYRLDGLLSGANIACAFAWAAGLDKKETIDQIKEMREFLKHYRNIDPAIVRAITDLAENIYETTLKEAYQYLGERLMSYDGTNGEISYSDIIDLMARLDIEMSSHNIEYEVFDYASITDERRDEISENEKRTRYSDQFESSTGIKIKVYWEPGRGKYIIRFPQITFDQDVNGGVYEYTSKEEEKVKKIFRTACEEAEKTDDPVQAFENVEW
jgi:hypothetical protein